MAGRVGDPSGLSTLYDVITTIVDCPPQVNKLCKLDPRRVALLIIPTPSSIVWCLPSTAVDSGNGWQIPTVTGNIDLSFARHGSLANMDWYGWGNGLGSAAIVIEVIYTGPAGGEA